MDQVWIGSTPTPADFQGRYKLLWTEKYLLVLAEIVDDTLVDLHPDPLDRYWDDDCLELFVDEDASGGPHRDSHQAFAYHIALDGQVADLGSDGQPLLLPGHVASTRRTRGDTTVWECAISLYPATYQQGSPANKPLKLQAGKRIGFAIAYCDNDHSAERENFMGSEPVAGEDKNQGYLNASIFGQWQLQK